MRARTAANDRAVRREREAARAAHNDCCDLCGAARGETGVCGIRRSEGRGLDFDHDHVGGGFRGLICWRANRWLARWVTPAFLREAAAYLERAGGCKCTPELEGRRLIHAAYCPLSPDGLGL